MPNDNPDPETREATLDGELSGDIEGHLHGTVAFTPTSIDDGDPGFEYPDEDDRHQFNGEAFSVRSTAHTPPMRYSFVIDNVLDAESLEAADSYTERDDGRYYVEGTIGPRGSDTYFVEGRLDEWDAVHIDTGDNVPSTRYETTVAGERHRLHTLLGNPEPEYDDTGPEHIGGGRHYSETVTAADADFRVSSHDELRTALSEASSGDVVFVDGDAELYSPSKSERYPVPAGVTLASDRGVDGSVGAILHTDAAYSYGAEGLVYATGDDARVTGLRIRGPHPQSDVRWRDHSYDYEMSGVNARAEDAERLEVDNCQIWGFAHAVASGTDGHVHHCHLAANMKGLGYCTSTGDTEGTVFEYNLCEHWRHVVAAGGGGGYEACYNLIHGPCIGHAFDQHRPGGTYTHLHHNTMTAEAKDISGRPVVFGTFRGDRVENVEVHHNWVQGKTKPALDVPSEYFTSEWLTMPKNGGNTWEGRVEWWENHLDASEPDDPSIGCPR